MTQPGDVSPKTMRRIGEIVCKRLLAMTSEEGTPVRDSASKETLRRLAIVLSGLEKDKRDILLSEIQGRDSDTATQVRSLMVTWDDIVKIEDKSLQQTLRNLSFDGAGQRPRAPIPPSATRSCRIFPERMKEMIEEEASLMGEPRKKMM